MAVRKFSTSGMSRFCSGLIITSQLSENWTVGKNRFFFIIVSFRYNVVLAEVTLKENINQSCNEVLVDNLTYFLLKVHVDIMGTC